MSSGWIVALELALVLGVAIAFALREFRTLKRLRQEREAANTRPPDP